MFYSRRDKTRNFIMFGGGDEITNDKIRSYRYLQGLKNDLSKKIDYINNNYNKNYGVKSNSNANAKPIANKKAKLTKGGNLLFPKRGQVFLSKEFKFSDDLKRKISEIPNVSELKRNRGKVKPQNKKQVNEKN